MLLSGVLVGGQALANRAQVVDIAVGQGHVVMFAIRPFWRWQTQGTYFLGFNAILNWNDLDGGVRTSRPRVETRLKFRRRLPSVASHSQALRGVADRGPAHWIC